MRLRTNFHLSFAAIIIVTLLVTLSALFNAKRSLNDLRTVVDHHVPFLELLSQSYNMLYDSIAVYDVFKNSQHVPYEKIYSYVNRVGNSIVQLQGMDNTNRINWSESTRILEELHSFVTNGAVTHPNMNSFSPENILQLKKKSRKILFQLRGSLRQSTFQMLESYGSKSLEPTVRNLFSLLFATNEVIEDYYSQDFLLTVKLAELLEKSKMYLNRLLRLQSEFVHTGASKKQLEEIIISLNRYKAAVFLFEDEKKLGVSGSSLAEIESHVNNAQLNAKHNLHELTNSTLANITTTQQQIIAENLKMQKIFIAGAIVGLILVGAILLTLTRVLIKSINTLVLGAESLALGNMEYRLKVGPKKEYLTRLTIAFNTMADTLQKREIEKTIYLERLNKAEKMEAIGLMAGGVAHDLNNILSGIVSYPELLLLKTPVNSELRRPLEAIRESGMRAAAIVSDLLAFARGTAIVKEIKNVNDLIVEYLDSPEHQKLLEQFPRVHFSIQLAPVSMYVSCSEIHVKKSIMNIIFNAFEAIHEQDDAVCSLDSKKISIKEDEALALGTGLVPGEYVVIRIRDNGNGISTEDIPHIFEPFYTKKKMGRSGTGLGLAIVYNSMREHHGSVVVESSTEGSQFMLYYPLCNCPPGNNVAGTEIDDLQSQSEEHILIVDDETSLRDIASQMLTSLNYKVHAVNSGEKAVQYLRNHSVDLVLLDMHMDPGMNGLMTYKKIIIQHPKQKAILASGYAESELVEKVFQYGIGGFINKPYSLVELGVAVKKELHGAGAS